MAGLDFRRAADLFISSEAELGAALGISAADVARFRRQPDEVPPQVLERLAEALIERGTAMERVGELLERSRGN